MVMSMGAESFALKSWRTMFWSGFLGGTITDGICTEGNWTYLSPEVVGQLCVGNHM